MTDEEETMSEQERRLRADLQQAASTRSPVGDWSRVTRATSEVPLVARLASGRAEPGRPRRVLVAAAAVLAVVAGATVAVSLRGDDDRVVTEPAAATTTTKAAPTTSSVPVVEGSSTTSTSTATSATTTTTPVSGPTTSAPIIARSVDLSTVALRVACPAGEIDFPAGSTAGAGGESLELGQPIRADLAADAQEEAVLTATCRDAGATATSVVVAQVAGSGSRQVGGPVIGDGPVVVGRTVVVTVTGAVPGGLGCCAPRTYVPYRVEGDDLIPGRGAVSAGALATTGGVGELRIGATFAEAAAILDGPVGLSFEDDTACGYLRLPGLEGQDGLVDETSITAISITVPGIRTRSGIGVGSSLDELRAAYPGGLVERPNDYDENALVLTLTDAARGTLAVFYSAGGTVTRYDVGRAGWADAVEGCH